MQGATLLLILAGFAVVAIGLVLAVRLGHRCGGDVDLVRGRRSRPWWGHPGVWILASGGFVLLGLFVFPKLFGFTFVFLPIFWPFLRVGGLWRGHSRAEDGRGRPEAPGRPDASDQP
jgi:hypothetical protein